MDTVVRVGVDVLDSRELTRLIERAWFLRFSYAPEEMAHAANMGVERRLEFLAGRFAAKEAVLKVLGKGMLQDIAPREICVAKAEDGSPVVRLLGRAADLAPSPIALSIAHKKNVVTAVAIRLQDRPEDATTDRTSEQQEASTVYSSNADNDSITAFLRVRIGQGQAHYGGGLVDGARILQIFGDLMTEITIRTDGDEGLLSEYSAVRFTAPVQPGDYIEATARLLRRTRLRRIVELKAYKVIEARPGMRPSAAETLDEPVLVCAATATTVVPLRDTTAITQGRRTHDEGATVLA
jgi:phosphopantetheine--protein transferase-like protein